MKRFQLNGLNEAAPAYGEEIAQAFRFRAKARTKDPRTYYGAAHDFQYADYWFRVAAARSIGHNRTARYEAAAERCWEAAQEYRAKYDNDIAGPGNGN